MNCFEPIKRLLLRRALSPTAAELSAAIEEISGSYGVQAALNGLLRAQVILGLRKPSLAIYDHTWHMIGGGQKYGFTMAHALQDVFEVTLLANREICHGNILEWYHLDLHKCKIKIVPLPFFGDWRHLDPARVTIRTENPFHLVALESGNYDFFINNSMNEKVLPLSNVSSLVCHFPERRPKDYFYADRYSHVIYNSDYTAGWIEKKWKFTPHKHIYPPVDMAPNVAADGGNKKENIILSVARFEEGGSKKQMEMVRTFLKLNGRSLMRDWRLVLAGGCADPEANAYLQGIKAKIKKFGADNIQLLVNCSGDQLKEMYAKGKIFWHLCGLDQTDPALVEHFGMTIVEAMQNGLVPIVFDGGGQREIVEHEVSGFRVSTTSDVMSFSLKLAQTPALRESMSGKAIVRSALFSREVFEKRVLEFYTAERDKYASLNELNELNELDGLN